MKRVAIVLIIICCISCSSTTDSVKTGTYKSVKLSKIEFGIRYIFQSVKTYPINCQLDLNVDSTFTYTTCGSINTGVWRSFSDSLLLFVVTNRFKIDSLNDTGFNGHFPKIPEKPIAYKINKNKLIRFIMFPGNEKGIEKLKLVPDSN